MMAFANTEAAGGWQTPRAARRSHSDQHYSKPLPPYGRALAAVRKDGLVPCGPALVTVDGIGHAGHTWPRLGIPIDRRPDEFDWTVVAALDVTLLISDTTPFRRLREAAEVILAAGPTRLWVQHDEQGVVAFLKLGGKT